MKDIDDSKAPLIEHLIELRRRLLWSVAVLVLLFGPFFLELGNQLRRIARIHCAPRSPSCEAAL